ncbi:MAG: TlpA family protein disulfide reductase [Phycisphaerales bacterium]|nr:TlpA family protein disulfide reductase [Phycisphaerales bacterium]
MSLVREISFVAADKKPIDLKIDRFLIINPGELAPDFEGTTLAGEKVKLSDLRGKVVLIDFWATWCAPCVAEMPNIKRAYDQYKDSGDFVVLGISVDNDPQTVSRFVTAKGVNWPQIAVGPSDLNPIAKTYYVSGVPATFLIDQEGKVVAKDLRGNMLEHYLKRLIKTQDQHAAK